MNVTHFHEPRTARLSWSAPWIAIACMAVDLTVTVRLAAQTNESRVFQPVTAVDGTPRPVGADVVFLTNGEPLRGKVLNDGMTLHTAHGSVRVETDWLAGININQRQLDRIKTVNRNQFSGFLNDPIEFRTASGEIVQLNKFEIDRIVFQQRADEVGRGVNRRFLVLENGDLLSGRLLNWNPQSRLAGNSAAGVLDDIESVQFVKGTRDLQILLRTGREMTASLNEDSLRLELDLGPVVVLPVSVVQTLYARTANLPLVVRQEFDEVLPSAGNASTAPPGPTPDGMVWIQPGRFQMGSSPAEQGHGPDEDPPTEVVITRGFWMGQHEVTQAEYLQLMGVNPSAYQGQTDLPVEKVTWNEAVAYCKRRTLAEHEAGRLPSGFVYRLPTEAEWEFACRAGSVTRFYFGDDLADTELSSRGWFINSSDSSTHTVGQLEPNAWGLYDMHGNVWEWCQDIWQDAYPGGMVTDYVSSSEGWLRVARGGSWLYDAPFCRSANRDSYGPDNRCSDIGFRVVLASPL